MNKCFISIIIILIVFVLNATPAFSFKIDYEGYLKYGVDYYLVSNYKNWNKYFKNVGKIYKKSWKYNKDLFKDNRYKTSYVRVLFVVNGLGQIISYDIKSSCVSHDDTLFLKKVKQTIESIKNLPTPYTYPYDIVFTVKFHTNIPDNINKKNIDWDRYGIADIELDNHNVKVIFKYDKDSK